MRILSLDQASYTTGYTVFDTGKIIKVSHFDCIGDDLADRLVQFREKITNLINGYEIDEVVCEDIQLQDKNGKEVGIKTFKILAEVLGVLCELLQELDMDYTIVPPIVWKATFKIAGKGRTEEKKLAQKYVLNQYGIKCTEDEADSVCIGLHLLKKSASEFDWS